MGTCLMPGTPARIKQDITMARMRANGDTLQTIGDKVGLSKGQVSNRLSTAEAKAIIEKESARLLAKLPDITNSTITQIQSANKIHNYIAGQKDELPKAFLTTDKDGNLVPDTNAALKYADIVAKRERDILQGMGILPSHSQSVVIQQIYNDNRTMSLDPAVISALGSALGQTGACDSEYPDDVVELAGDDDNGYEVVDK